MGGRFVYVHIKLHSHFLINVMRIGNPLILSLIIDAI
jgi:hypothetical protein